MSEKDPRGREVTVELPGATLSRESRRPVLPKGYRCRLCRAYFYPPDIEAELCGECERWAERE